MRIFIFCLIMMYFMIIRFVFMVFYPVPYPRSGNSIYFLMIFPIYISIILYLFPIRKFNCKDKIQYSIVIAFVHFFSTTCGIGLTLDKKFLFVCIGSLAYIVVLNLPDLFCRDKKVPYLAQK